MAMYKRPVYNLIQIMDVVGRPPMPHQPYNAMNFKRNKLHQSIKYHYKELVLHQM